MKNCNFLLAGFLAFCLFSFGVQAQDSVRQKAIDYINKASRASNGKVALGYRYLDTAKQIIFHHHLTEAGIRAGFVETNLLLRSGKIDEALHYNDSMALELKSPGLAKFVPRNLRIRANIIERQGDASRAIFLMRNALDSAIALKDTAQISVISSNLGNKYYHYGANEKALEAYLLSLRMKRALGQTSRLSYIYQGLAAVALGQKNYPECRRYARKAIANFQEHDLACGAIQMMSLLGTTYDSENRSDSAFFCAREALKYAQDNQCRLGVFYAYHVLGQMYFSRQEYEAAQEYYLKALAGKELLNPVVAQEMLGDMSSIYLARGEFDKAGKYIDSCREMAGANGIISRQKLYEKEAEYYKATRQWEKAVEKSEMNYRYLDSLHSMEKDRILEEMKIQYAVQQMEADQASLNNDLLLVRKDNQIKEQRLSARNAVILAISLGLVGAVTSFFLLIKVVRSRSRRKELMLSQQLRRAQINPHFFFNVLNSIQAQINRSQDKQMVVKNVANFARLMRQTLESSLQDFICITDEVERLGHYIDLQNMRFREHFEYEIVNSCQGTPAIPSQLIQPFVENAIEHGFRDLDDKGYLSIHFSYADQQRIKIEIRDNGPGPEKKEEPEVAPAKTSRALEIIGQRLRLFGNPKKYFFELSRENTLTLATIYCPFR